MEAAFFIATLRFVFLTGVAFVCSFDAFFMSFPPKITPPKLFAIGVPSVNSALRLCVVNNFDLQHRSPLVGAVKN